MQKPLYITIAEKELGQKEVAGDGSNPQIIQYFLATTFKATSDETYWCAAFVSWCLEQADIQSTKSAWALSYSRWGTEVKQPELYTIAVLKRNGGGHVGFVTDFDLQLGTVTLLGGNQHDMVKYSTFKIDDVITYRRPFYVYSGVQNT